MPDVRLHWLQVPMRISNGTSHYQQWLQCWEPDGDWMREKEPDSIHDNVFGTPTFADMFLGWQRIFQPDRGCLIAGVRTEEAPSRRLGLTVYETWGGETWGRKGDETHFTWYPVYDWRIQDVWHYIAKNDIPYSQVYDRMWQYGVPPHKMRVSSLHHESALATLFMLQEVEPETWDKLSSRIAGVHSAGQLNWAAFKVKELPPMFRTWKDYRDHLLENLIVDPTQRERMRTQFYGYDRRFADDPAAFAELMRTQIKCLLVGDDHGTKLTVFEASHLGKSKNRGRISGRQVKDDAGA
jgi:predicted phosphoadenosine phosphosulfate sulfurtransferase